MRIKKNAKKGTYDLGQNVRVPGKKTPRFKVLLHLGKNPTIDAAIEARRRDRCDPRRGGESQIEAESRRAKAKLIIDQLKTMKMRAENEAAKMARDLVTKTVLKKMATDPRMIGLDERIRKELEEEEKEEKDRITRAQLQQAAAQVEQATRDLQPSPESVQMAARRSRSLQHGRVRILQLMQNGHFKLPTAASPTQKSTPPRRSVLVRCRLALDTVESKLRAKFPAWRYPS